MRRRVSAALLRRSRRGQVCPIGRCVACEVSVVGLKFQCRNESPRCSRPRRSRVFRGFYCYLPPKSHRGLTAVRAFAGFSLRALREEARRTSVGCTGVARSAVGQRDITVGHGDQDHSLPMRAEVSRRRWAERDGARGGPIVSGRDGQCSGELLRTGEFIRCEVAVV